MSSKKPGCFGGLFKICRRTKKETTTDEKDKGHVSRFFTNPRKTTKTSWTFQAFNQTNRESNQASLPRSDSYIKAIIQKQSQLNQNTNSKKGIDNSEIIKARMAEVERNLKSTDEYFRPPNPRILKSTPPEDPRIPKATPPEEPKIPKIQGPTCNDRPLFPQMQTTDKQFRVIEKEHEIDYIGTITHTAPNQHSVSTITYTKPKPVVVVPPKNSEQSKLNNTRTLEHPGFGLITYTEVKPVVRNDEHSLQVVPVFTRKTPIEVPPESEQSLVSDYSMGSQFSSSYDDELSGERPVRSVNAPRNYRLLLRRQDELGGPVLYMDASDVESLISLNPRP